MFHVYCVIIVEVNSSMVHMPYDYDIINIMVLALQKN